MNIYQDCFDLIVQYIYGGVELTSNMELVAITLATTACVFVFALPFLVVWKVIRMILG